MNVVHLTASPFFGGPERQMLGLALSLPASYRSTFLSFSERGLCRPFLQEVRRHGFEALELQHNAPRIRPAVRELVARLKYLRAHVLCSHGYKADLLGWLAVRQSEIPIVAVSRGWTGVTLKVCIYDAIDRLCLRGMNAVVCVSEGQAMKVRRAGVNSSRVHVIRNAIHADRFKRGDALCRERLLGLFPQPPRLVIGGAGRLSPEKGFGLLVEAAPAVLRQQPDAAFVLFGDGLLRQQIAGRVAALGLQEKVILPGFRTDLDNLIPALDLMVLPSYTEGLPNVVLESFAARVPVVATAVGGTPEVVDDRISGFLVKPGDVAGLACRIAEILSDARMRRQMGLAGWRRVQQEFTFAAQARSYQTLFEDLLDSRTEPVLLAFNGSSAVRP
jgi:glycosyltransferase involved in cell wall biosynthesis